MKTKGYNLKHNFGHGKKHLLSLLKHRLRSSAPGLTPRSELEQMKGILMIDVQIPTTDGRQLSMSRFTQPDKAQQILFAQLGMTLPPQPPPKITREMTTEAENVVKT